MMQSLAYHISLALLRCFALLPLSLAYGISDVAYILVYKVFGYRAKVVRKNLTLSFPEKTSDEILGIERKFYRHFCDLFVETVKLLHISDAELNRRIRVDGGEEIELMSQDGKPIIVMLGHFGNWEWVQKFTWHYQHPAINAEIYRPVKDKVFDRLMKRIRARFATEQIPQKQAVRTLLRHHSRGEQFLVGFISDQRPTNTNSHNLRHWITFLNQDTAYVVGGEEIGRHVDAHYVFLTMEKPQRGHYGISINPITPSQTDVDHPYTVEFMRLMEQSIRNSPHLWLWTHKRWRYNRNGEKLYQ